MHRRYIYAGALVLMMSVFALSSCSLYRVPNPQAETNQTQMPTEPAYIQQQRGVAIYYPRSVQPVLSAQSQQQRMSSQSSDTRLAYTQSSGESLTMQVQNSLAEAETLVSSGEARLREGNLRDAVLEFERARILIEQDLDPALAQIKGQSTVQGGVGILSASQIQGVSGERAELIDRINEAYDLRGALDQQQELDKLNKLREANRFQLTPVSSAPSDENSRLIPVERQNQPQQTTPVSQTPNQTWNWQDELAGDVERNIHIFQQRQADFDQCLQRANQYFPQVVSILRSYSVPPEIAYIALIESGFQPNAVSSSGRAGLWQLSAAQARQYGLRTSSSSGRDERFSIEASTHAFARYISSKYQHSGSWRLAVISHSPQQDYLSKLIAAMTIASDPQTYGFHSDTSNLSTYMDTSWAQGWSDQSSRLAPASSRTTEMLEPPSATLY